MKKRKTLKIKALLSILLIIVLLISIIFFSFSITLYKIETFYRLYAIIILGYFFLLLTFLLLNSIRKEKLIKFIIPSIITILFTAVNFTAYYYLHNIYKAVDSYSETTNMYYTSLVSYNKNFKTYEDLKNCTIGIVEDTSDIEGNILPLETIEKLKLEETNTIKKYNSTIELLHDLKEKEIDAAFFSRNYVDMFYSMEGFENIETETVVLHEYSKIYESTEEDIKSEAASFKEPFTMLLIGVDSSKDGVTSGYNADVLLLATFNPKTLRATLTSVPRDMYLKTACSNGAYRRINTTTWGSSASCAVKTIENLFDVDIDYYAKINFKGVVQLVDSVGGINVDVPYSFCEQNSSRKWGKNTVFLEKGKQKLNGEQALALARNRHKPNDGSAAGKQMGKYCPTLSEGKRNDYTRGKNQMKVILGVLSSATKLTDPNQALDILKTIKPNFQTNVKTDDVLSLYDLAKSIVLGDGTNLINVQRMQLKGYSAYGHVYDKNSKSYPAVTIPYNESIKEIKEAIKINLGKKKPTLIKEISFDISDPFQDEVIGQDKYSQSKIETLKDVSKYSVKQIKDYASKNKLELKFIDSSNNQTVELDSYGEYVFNYQKEHKDLILDQTDTLTIYVKKQTIIKPEIPTTKPEEENPVPENPTPEEPTPATSPA